MSPEAVSLCYGRNTDTDTHTHTATSANLRDTFCARRQLALCREVFAREILEAIIAAPAPALGPRLLACHCGQSEVC